MSSVDPPRAPLCRDLHSVVISPQLTHSTDSFVARLYVRSPLTNSTRLLHVLQCKALKSVFRTSMFTIAYEHASSVGDIVDAPVCSVKGAIFRVVAGVDSSLSSVAFTRTHLGNVTGRESIFTRPEFVHSGPLSLS